MFTDLYCFSDDTVILEESLEVLLMALEELHKELVHACGEDGL